MSRPSIGTAITPAMEEEQKLQLKELTVLQDGSKESIYHQVFLIMSGKEQEAPEAKTS